VADDSRPANPAKAPVAAGEWLLLLAAALLGFFSNIGRMPLFDLDEGAFSEATLELLRSGNWLTTTLNGAPRYDKPILIYWLQALSVKTFGVSEFAFRFPSAICATLWMLAVWSFARRHCGGPRAAMIAAVTLALGLMSSIIGHAAIADALLDLLLALTFLDLWRHYESQRRAPLLRAYLWMGLGFLAKGPVAIVLPVLVSFLYSWYQARLREWWRMALDPIGWLILLATLAVWLVPLWFYDHGSFLEHFLVQHNLDRYDTTLQGHGGHLWYYLLWLPLIVLPFTGLLPGTLRAAWRQRDPLDVFLLLWFAVVFVIFSFSATQLPHYLLYGATPLFLLFGRHFASAPRRTLALLPPLLLALLLVALPWVLPLIPIPPQRSFEAGIVHLAEAHLGTGYQLLTLANLLVVLGLMFWRRPALWRALIAVAFAQGVAVWFAVVPALAAAQQDPIRQAALIARALHLPAVSYDTFLPSFSVYRGRITPERLPAPGELVLVRLDRIAGLEKHLPGVHFKTIYRHGGIALLLRPKGGA
jgi:4-amino-4-deoxy-L-arabinose transferase and related glycosyltransferases of PMT family